MLRRTILLAALTTAAPLTIVSASQAGSIRQQVFQAAGGSITCRMAQAPTLTWVWCANPATLAVDVDADCGSASAAAYFELRGKARLVGACEDPAAGQIVPTLAPGRSTTFHGTRCAATSTSVTCRSLRSGHGFELRDSGPRFF